MFAAAGIIFGRNKYYKYSMRFRPEFCARYLSEGQRLTNDSGDLSVSYIRHARTIRQEGTRGEY